MEVEVIVEVPQGSRNKYVMDPKTGRIRLDRMLFTSTRYPLDYGFVTETLAEDGEPLDALIGKVGRHANRVTDEDITAAKASGLSEDEVFEIVVCAAVGQATRQYDTAVAALEAATGKE